MYPEFQGDRKTQAKDREGNIQPFENYKNTQKATTIAQKNIQ